MQTCAKKGSYPFVSYLFFSWRPNKGQYKGNREKCSDIYIEAESPLYKEALYISRDGCWRERGDSRVQIFKLSSIPFVRLPVTCWQHSAYVTRTQGFIVIRLRLLLLMLKGMCGIPNAKNIRGDPARSLFDHLLLLEQKCRLGLSPRMYSSNNSHSVIKKYFLLQLRFNLLLSVWNLRRIDYNVTGFLIRFLPSN